MREVLPKDGRLRLVGGLPWWSVVKNPPASTVDVGSILGPLRVHMPWN